MLEIEAVVKETSKGFRAQKDSVTGVGRTPREALEHLVLQLECPWAYVR